MNQHLQELFSQAYIIGGSPCSGKSTMAERLSADYGFRYYKVDNHDQEHLQRCQPDQQPIMYKYSNMGWDAIWSQPVLKLLADELAYYRERFPFIIDDLCQFGPGQPLLLEGVAFLPELVETCPVNRQQVIFMVPTYDFQVAHYSQRPWMQSILNGCQNPAQAFENWMQRDALFGQEVIQQAQTYRFPSINVDGSVNIQGQFEEIRTRFGLESVQT